MPPATTGAGPFIDPPFARTPFSVGNCRLVSYVHMMAPVDASYARTAPSFEGEKTTPGITVTAENWAPLQPRWGLPHTGGGAAVVHARRPSRRPIACSPPGASL